MRRLRDRARRRRTTLTAELQAAVDSYLSEDEPNAGLLSLAGRFASKEDWPPADSDEVKRDMADSIARNALGRDLASDTR